jgi:hypothetical protein
MFPLADVLGQAAFAPVRTPFLKQGIQREKRQIGKNIEKNNSCLLLGKKVTTHSFCK